MRSDESALKAGSTAVIADEEVRGGVCEPVHRASRRDARRDRLRTAEVLDGCEQARFLDP